MIKENVEGIRSRITEACAMIKVDPGKITVICVTKGRTVPQIQEAVNLGLKHIGENRVQEAQEKHEQIFDVKWHMIGHLQSNKVRDALKMFDLIHSVDSVSLARQINQHAFKMNKIQDIFLEVKTSSEVSKFGFKEEVLADACAEIMKLKQVSIKGLMTIAPVQNMAGAARPYFSKLRQLRDKLNSGWLLSMGMSDDFEVAIEEGADIIRLGRAVFEG
jgi:hypothetical protein